MKLYHGTNMSSAFNIFSGIDFSKSGMYLDFGIGFYATNDKNKAISMALKKTESYNKRNNKDDIPCVVDITLNKKILENLNVLRFEDNNQKWCDFVLNNRLDDDFLIKNNITFHNRNNQYDVVIGEIADGKVAKIAYNIRNGKLSITDIDFNKFYTDDGQSYGTQTSFHTKESLSCISINGCDIIRTKQYEKVANRNA